MSRTLAYTVPPEWDGRPVKEFVRRFLGLSSRVLVKQKHLTGGLLKNGVPCRSVDLLCQGDVLQLCLPEEREQYEAVEGLSLFCMRMRITCWWTSRLTCPYTLRPAMTGTAC